MSMSRFFFRVGQWCRLVLLLLITISLVNNLLVRMFDERWFQAISYLLSIAGICLLGYIWAVIRCEKRYDEWVSDRWNHYTAQYDPALPPKRGPGGTEIYPPNTMQQ